ncbi:opsin-3 isoform X2 [Eumetopias jubatus]|uniref:opsin-3 isoform X2 n=1 Tax=Eumetopias jubatus TaxID=34886 RepID=UPI001016C8A7|nr:opsin-3 isoform X2 [Eumetopias jubatus]
MYSGNRSGGQGHWEGGGAAGAEGLGPAGTLSPAPLFSPGTYERLALLLGSIGLLGVGNNLLVLVLYYKFQRLRTPTHLLLVNICLSDLLVSLFGVTFTFVSCLRNGWVWDTVGCVWDGFSSSLFDGKTYTVKTKNLTKTTQLLRCVEDLQTIQVIKILRYEKKVAKMCFLMIFIFLIFWMPYIVISFLVVNGYGHLVTPTVSIVSYLFAKSSTVYNPIIYIIMIRKFRRSLLQLLCFRLLRCQRPAKDLPANGSEMQIRPIVMSQKDGDRPKKKVTFNSSSIIFIITSDESLSVDDSDKTSMSKVDVIQVRPL